MYLKHFGSAGQCCISWIHCSLGLEHTTRTLCTECVITSLRADHCCLKYHGSKKSLLFVMRSVFFCTYLIHIKQRLLMLFSPAFLGTYVSKQHVFKLCCIKKFDLRNFCLNC